VLPEKFKKNTEFTAEGRSFREGKEKQERKTLS